MRSPIQWVDRIEYVLGVFDKMNSQEIGVFSRGIIFRDRSTRNESLFREISDICLVEIVVKSITSRTIMR